MKTCVTPLHEKFPSGITNVKISDMTLYISQTVIQGIFKFQNIYLYGKFNKELQRFILQEPLSIQEI